jgi:hypothetical protein
MKKLRGRPLSSAELLTASPAAIVAAIDVVILANPPDARILLFVGGWHAGLFGAATLLLLPLIIAVQFGLGVALGHALGADRRLAKSAWLYWLSGTAVMSLTGVAVAIVGGLNPLICGGLLVLGTAYAFGPARSELFETVHGLLDWLRLREITVERPAFAVVRLGIVIATALIALRAATGELNDTDFVQFYWGWFQEVRHLGSIWLSPERPLILDFVIGRGNGAYLLIAGIAPGLVVGVVSAAYCILFAVILRSFVLYAVSGLESNPSRLALCAADVSCLASLWLLPGAISFGKYHLQFAAWALGMLLGALLVATSEEEAGRTRCFLLVPLAIALPIGLPQFELFAVLTIGTAITIVNPRSSASTLAPLMIAGVASAALSLLVNWIYLGIPDLNPFQLLQRFIIDQRFAFWTSRLQQYDLNYISGGVLTFAQDDDVGLLRKLRSLVGGLWDNRVPFFCMAGSIVGGVVLTPFLRLRWSGAGWTNALLGLVLGFTIYRLSSTVTLSELATNPIANQVAICTVAVAAYLVSVLRTADNRLSHRFSFALLAYWGICEAFVLVFHSGNLDRFMRHADAVAVSLLLVGLVYLERNIPRRLARATSLVPLLLAFGVFFSVRAGVAAARVDPLVHLVDSTFGLRGRSTGLTHPMARFDRCDQIAASVPANARVLFLNAYTAMAYCNNAVLLPRAMVVAPHQSDYARDIADDSFADADEVVAALRRLQIDYFVILKGDFEFWASGLSAPFRPAEISHWLDIIADTPSFFIFTWRGSGKPIPAEVLAVIAEWWRTAVQEQGFISNNEFVSPWRAMANLGADRPKYRFGSRLDFTARGWSALYADHGWYAAEPEGTWTIGPRAVLTLPFERPARGALEADVDFTPFLVPQVPSRLVSIRLGDRLIDSWILKLGEGRQVRKIELPADLAADKTQLVFTFEIANPISPYALSLSADWRPIGIWVHNVTLNEIPDNR